MTRARAPRLLVACPSFPAGGDANDGQSVYVVESTRALARALGAPVDVLALRLGDEPAREDLGDVVVERVEPAVPVPGVFALYEPGCFPRALAPLARRAAERMTDDAGGGEREAADGRLTGRALIAHGYELGHAVHAVRGAREARGEQGPNLVGVVHYLLADESLHYLSAGSDPTRAHLLPTPVSTLARLTPASWRGRAVRAASLVAPWASALPSAPGASSIVGMQLAKLASERAFLGACDRVVAVGRRFADTVRRHYPEHAARVRGCFAGAPAAAPVRERERDPGDRRDGDGRLRLLLVGRPTPQKGWDYLAEALHAIERSAPDVADRLELRALGGLGEWRGPTTGYGQGVLERLSALRRVRFSNLGRRSREGTAAAYREADVLVMPSVYEPFGLVLVEAMAAGLPILASDADGPADVVHQAFGFVVPFGDATSRVAGLVEAILRFFRLDHGQRAAMSAAARRAAATYSWDDTAAHLLAAAREATLA